MKRQTRFCIPAAWHGVSLLEFLAERFPYHDRDGWETNIRSGRVLLDGARASPTAYVRHGEWVEYLTDDIPEPPVDSAVEIVYEDPDLAVINKPGNLPCHPGGRYFKNTLWALLKARHGIAEPIFVNRLDRETSGLMIVAITESAGRECRRQFADREVEKRYRVFVEGAFPHSMNTRGILVPDPAAGVRKKRRFVSESAAGPTSTETGAESAETHFRLVSQFGPVSELEARPLTGRLHQIRATLCSLGFPVVGDKLYGPDPALFLRFCQGTLSAQDQTRLRMGRQALHASGLELRHPRTRKPLAFSLPLPPDLLTLQMQLQQADDSRPG